MRQHVETDPRSARTPLERPILVVGAGRSGTTIFYRTLARHPDLGAVQNFEARWPWLLRTGVSRVAAAPAIRGLIERVREIEPAGESVHLYQYAGIDRLGVPLREREPSERESRRFKTLVARSLHFQQKNRWIHKNTTDGLRIGYMHRLFPDAYFIHIVRDGRAVANSLLHVPFFAEIRLWWAQRRTLQQLVETGSTPLEVAATHWKRTVEEILEQYQALPANQCMQLKYEDFAADPAAVCARVLEFCGVSLSPEFLQQVRELPIRSRNEKWSKGLDEEAKHYLSDFLGPTLRRLGYHVD